MADRAKRGSKPRASAKRNATSTDEESDAPKTSGTEKTVSETAVYRFRSDRATRLKVTIGEAQVGATTLRLNGAAVPFLDQQNAVEIGVVGSVSVLDCVSLVHDVNPATNRTSVSYELTGGVEPKTFTYALEASEKGQVRYEISFLLV